MDIPNEDVDWEAVAHAVGLGKHEEALKVLATNPKLRALIIDTASNYGADVKPEVVLNEIVIQKYYESVRAVQYTQCAK